MTVGCVYNHQVYAGFYEGGDAVICVCANTDTGRHTQLALMIFTGHWKGFCFGDVFYRNHACELRITVHQQHLFNAMLVQQTTNFREVGAFLCGNKTIARRHDVAHAHAGTLLKPHIATGDNAHELITVDNWHARYAVIPG